VADAGAAASSSEINGIIAGTTSKPIVRLVASGTQSISDSTATAIAFTAEDIDTDGFHDTSTNNTRITPTKAGYYWLKGVYYTSGRTDFVTVDAAIGKNGTAVAPAGRKNFSTAATQVSNALSVECGAYQAANGTTDYFELIGFQDNAANAAQNTNQAGRFSCTLECEFVRDL